MVHELVGGFTFLVRHAAVAGGGARAHLGGSAPQGLLADAESAPKLMPAIVIGICNWMGLLACRVPSVVAVSQRTR